MKTLRRFLIAVAAAVASLWLAVGLMRSPFVIESGVVNDTTSTLEAVPLVLADNMPIVLVPRYSSEPLRIYSLLRDDTPLVVPPNASARLLYDYDNLNLCWLMVRAQGTSRWKFVPSRLAATPSCAPPPELNHPCLRSGHRHVRRARAGRARGRANVDDRGVAPRVGSLPRCVKDARGRASWVVDARDAEADERAVRA